MGVKDSSSTLNATDTSAAKVLKPAPSASEREGDERPSTWKVLPNLNSPVLTTATATSAVHLATALLSNPRAAANTLPAKTRQVERQVTHQTKNTEPIQLPTRHRRLSETSSPRGP
jgi:hypothetical protein